MDGFPELQSPSETQRHILATVSGKALQEDDIVKLRSRWNDTIPIACLPREILLEIFEILASCASLAPSHCHEDRKNPYTWIRCTHVCRYWRDLALAAPTLWRRITPASDECMDTMVERAGVYVALSIRYEHEPWLTTEGPGQPEVSGNMYYNLFYHLLPDFPIETLEIPARADFPRGVHLARKLRTLVINGSFIEDPEIGPRDWEEPLFHPDGLPILRELVVRYGSPLTVWSVFRRTLEVLDVHRMDVPQPVVKWLDALKEMPNLRRLRLVEVMAGIDSAESSPVELGNVTIPLLRLDHLHLGDTLSGAALLQFLEHITTKTVHNLTMEVSIPEDEELPVSETQIVRLVRAMNSKRDCRAPFTLSIKTFEFQERVRIMIVIRATPSIPKARVDQPQPSSLPEPYNQSLIFKVDPPRAPDFILSALREIPAKLVRRLILDVHFDANLLRPYFESDGFPRLRVLEPSGETAEAVLSLLAPRQNPSPSTETSVTEDSTEADAAVSSAATVLFPALTRIHWSDVFWRLGEITGRRPTLFEQLITVLEQRKECTNKALTMMSLYDSPELAREDVERLRSRGLVHRVNWNGRDEMVARGFGRRWRFHEMLRVIRREGMILELRTRALKMLAVARGASLSDSDDSWDEDDTDEDENSDDAEEEDVEDENEDEEEETDDAPDDGDQDEYHSDHGDEGEDQA